MINIIPSVWLYTIPFFAIAGGSPNSQDMITTNVLKITVFIACSGKVTRFPGSPF
jgi:hypothetical protein